MTQPRATHVNLIPVVRYTDCTAAAAMFTDTFGFSEGRIFRDEGGRIVHGEFSFGHGGVMIGPVADTPFGKYMRQPRQAGGITASFFVIVTDPDAIFGRCEAAGLEVLLPLRDEDYGSREFTIRDPEGHIWTFGTYEIAVTA